MRLSTQLISRLAPAKMTSPSVSKVRKSQDVMAMFAPRTACQTPLTARPGAPATMSQVSTRLTTGGITTSSLQAPD
jgi:hypothetical protein